MEKNIGSIVVYLKVCSEIGTWLPHNRISLKHCRRRKLDVRYKVKAKLAYIAIWSVFEINPIWGFVRKLSVWKMCGLNYNLKLSEKRKPTPGVKNHSRMRVLIKWGDSGIDWLDVHGHELSSGKWWRLMAPSLTYNAIWDQVSGDDDMLVKQFGFIISGQIGPSILDFLNFLLSLHDICNTAPICPVLSAISAPIPSLQKVANICCTWMVVINVLGWKVPLS